MLVNCKITEVPVILGECESTSLSEAKTLVRQLLATQYPAKHEESPVPDFQEVATIDMLAGDLDAEADRHLDDFTGSRDLGS